MVGVYLLALVSEKLIEKSTGAKFSSRKTKVNKLVVMAMFSALAVVIMYFEFPIPFIAPGFYEMDLSEIPILIGSFMYGPVAGVVMEAVKILLKLCLKGTSTAFVGDFANFIMGCCIVVPASVIYHTKKNKKRAIIGLVAGGLTLIVVGGLMNGLYLLPKYSELYGVPIEAFIKQGSDITPAISNIATFVMLAVVPFNLIKAVIVGTVTGLLYKHVSRLLQLQNQ
ncbi:MAG: ECF transporter S component [Lachnospira sp.]|nr:ECF transporter S component [Lachnospira sp.]